MKNKIKKMDETAWLLGILLCALGVCLCTKANFGLSMIAAPAYIVFRKLSLFLPFLTQGMTEYLWQALLLVVTCLIVRRFRLRYVFTFLTAVLFGFALDGWLWVFGGGDPFQSLVARIISFAAGTLITTLSIAFFFRTSLPLEVYELTVAEVSDRYDLNVDRVKLFNDMIFLALSIGLTLLLHGDFVGVGIGTVVVTFVNAPLISFFGKILDKLFEFSPRFPRLTTFLHPENKQ